MSGQDQDMQIFQDLNTYFQIPHLEIRNNKASPCGTNPKPANQLEQENFSSRTTVLGEEDNYFFCMKMTTYKKKECSSARNV